MKRMVHDGTRCSYKDAFSLCVRGDCRVSAMRQADQGLGLPPPGILSCFIQAPLPREWCSPKWASLSYIN